MSSLPESIAEEGSMKEYEVIIPVRLRIKARSESEAIGAAMDALCVSDEYDNDSDPITVKEVKR